MSHRIVTLLTIVAGLSAARPALGADAPPRSRPNVIVLLSDDQGYGDLSCHGNPYLKTPNLDRLHAESVRFTDFHVAPMCTPTRGQLMTGMDALHNGATSVTYGRALLRRGIPTMAEAFAAGGYRTGLFGKWHLGDAYPYRPIDRGFQESDTFYGFGLTSAPEFDNDYANGRYRHNGQAAQPFKGYCTDVWFDLAMAWMKERKAAGEPFFTYLPTNVPHGPAWVDPKYAEPFKRDKKLPASFFGMIVNLDENVGRLDAFLRDNGLRDDTILVFMSDNGGTGGVKVYNAGMRGHKTEYYEGGHRVPCFVRWPAGRLRPPGDVAAPTQVQDVLPTLIDLCGLTKPSSAAFDGVSLAGLLRDPAAALPDRMFVVQYGQDLTMWESCVVWNQWRLVGGTALYDVRAELAQQTDVAAQHADVVDGMREHYEAWWATTEPTRHHFEPITIGSDRENPVHLSSADWEAVYCDNSPNVRQGLGGTAGGPWNVIVDQDGDYEIALRRWPAQADAPLASARPEQHMTYGTYPAGKAFPIAKATLSVGAHTLAKDVGPADTAAVFTVHLKKGTTTHLYGHFQDAQGTDLCGAYYADARRK